MDLMVDIDKIAEENNLDKEFLREFALDSGNRYTMTIIRDSNGDAGRITVSKYWIASFVSDAHDAYTSRSSDA